jgi:hypothetical protein
MKRTFFIFLIIILLSSCEKSQDKTEHFLKFYGDALEDIGYSVAKVEDGYIITGQLTDVAYTNGILTDEKNSVKKMGIIKTGTDGNVIWEKSLPDNLAAVGSKVLALEDGSIVATGYAIDQESMEKDIIVIKLDAEGEVLIQKIYKVPGNQYGIDIVKTQYGFLILGSTDVAKNPVTESTGNNAGKKDILLRRIDNNLDSIGSPKSEGFPFNDEGVAIKPDLNGGYIVVGTTERSDQQSSVQSGTNIILLKVNADGSTTEPRIIGGTGNEYAADIEVLNDGYLIAGTLGDEGPDQRGYVWKISQNIYDPPIFSHKLELETTGATPASFSLKTICRFKTNSFVMAGQTGAGINANLLIFLTDAEGYQVEGKKKNTNVTGIQTIYDVISDENDNIIAVGKNSYEENSMISLLKFRF